MERFAAAETVKTKSLLERQLVVDDKFVEHGGGYIADFLRLGEPPEVAGADDRGWGLRGG
jgi:hypothetical protein